MVEPGTVESGRPHARDPHRPGQPERDVRGRRRGRRVEVDRCRRQLDGPGAVADGEPGGRHAGVPAGQQQHRLRGHRRGLLQRRRHPRRRHLPLHRRRRDVVAAHRHEHQRFSLRQQPHRQPPQHATAVGGHAHRSVPVDRRRRLVDATGERRGRERLHAGRDAAHGRVGLRLRRLRQLRAGHRLSCRRQRRLDVFECAEQCRHGTQLDRRGAVEYRRGVRDVGQPDDRRSWRGRTARHLSFRGQRRFRQLRHAVRRQGVGRHRPAADQPAAPIEPRVRSAGDLWLWPLEPVPEPGLVRQRDRRRSPRREPCVGRRHRPLPVRRRWRQLGRRELLVVHQGRRSRVSPRRPARAGVPSWLQRHVQPDHVRDERRRGGAGRRRACARGQYVGGRLRHTGRGQPDLGRS